MEFMWSIIYFIVNYEIKSTGCGVDENRIPVLFRNLQKNLIISFVCSCFILVLMIFHNLF